MERRVKVYRPDRCNPPMGRTANLLAEAFVPGNPNPFDKSWSSSVIDRTMVLTPIAGPCELEVEFVLPQERSILDGPLHEQTLDLLLRGLLEGVSETLLRTHEGPMGGKGTLVSVRARRRTAGPREQSGVRILLQSVRPPS